MFGGQYCEGSLVGPLDHRHWALAVCVHIPFLVLRCCRHVLSVAHNGTGEGGTHVQQFSCQHWTRIETISIKIVAQVFQRIH